MELDPYPYLIWSPSETLATGWEPRTRLADPLWLSFWDEETERCEFRPRTGYEQDEAAYKL